MKYRLATLTDIDKLARIHLECGKKQVDSFMHKLELPFFRVYYNIVLKEMNSFILVAEDENGFIYGFTSGTLAAEEHIAALRKNRLKLAFAVLPALIKSPWIIKELIKRNRFINLNYKAIQYIVTNGPRIDYWGWVSINRHMSVYLFKTWLKVAFSRGAKLQ